jgi:effector-binding domain-containing protein
MTGPLRAIALAAVLTLCVSAPAWSQVSAPPPPQVQPPPPPPPGPPPTPAPRAEIFGEEFALTSKTIVFMKGNSTWDAAYDTLVDAFKSVYAFVDKQGLKRDGLPMTIYTSADDTGFQFQAAVPVTELPKEIPSGDIGAGKSPAGKAYKFVHRGSYDSMDATYEAITNFLDEKRLEAQDLFVEEYVTDPVTSPDDKLEITVYVPVK